MLSFKLDMTWHSHVLIFSKDIFPKFLPDNYFSKYIFFICQGLTFGKFTFIRTPEEKQGFSMFNNSTLFCSQALVYNCIHRAITPG